MKNLIIARVMWNQGEETFYGPFNLYEEYVKWAEEFMKENSDEIDEILFDWLINVNKDFEEQK
jgi:hypothetical protein